MPINFSTNKDLLTELGYGSGGINDGWFQYLGSLGYTGSLDDRWRKFLREEFPDRADASLGDLTYEYFSRGGGGAGAPILATWVNAKFTNDTLPVRLFYNPATTFYETDYVKTDWIGSGSTIYVATTGNDTTGDGSSGAPYLTVQKAITEATSGDVIRIAPGRYNAAISNPGSKNLSFINDDPDTGRVYIGRWQSEANITWGALTSGRQTATLAASTVSFFVDTTRTDSELGGFQVSRNGDATYAAAQQALGNAVEIDGTPSTIGSGDSRDMEGEADTTIFVCSATDAPDVVTLSAGTWYFEDITVIGGVILGSTCTFVAEGCDFYGGDAEVISSPNGGTSILSSCLLRGAGRTDVIDYRSTSKAVEIKCKMDQPGRAFNDNTSTAHVSSTVVRLGGRYRGGSRCIHDVGAGTVAFIDGCTIGGDLVDNLISLAAGTGAENTEMWIAKVTFVAGATTNISNLATNAGAQIHFVDPASDFAPSTNNFVPASVIWQNTAQPAINFIHEIVAEDAGLADDETADGAVVDGLTFAVTGTGVVYSTDLGAGKGAFLFNGASGLLATSGVSLTAGSRYIFASLFQYDSATAIASNRFILAHRNAGTDYIGRSDSGPLATANRFFNSGGDYWIDSAPKDDLTSLESFVTNGGLNVYLTFGEITNAWSALGIGSYVNPGFELEGYMVQFLIAPDSIANRWLINERLEALAA